MLKLTLQSKQPEVRYPLIISDTNFFVASLNSLIVGVVIITKCNVAQALVDQFDIGEFISVKLSQINGKFNMVKYIIFQSGFENKICSVLSEIMKYSDLQLLMHANTSKTPGSISEKNIRNYFVPVRYRKTIQFPKNIRDGENVPDPLLFSLSILTEPLINYPRIAINTRIIVIGSSDVGLSFLENLIYVLFD